MPHVQEGVKEDIHDARKQLADAIGDLQNKVDPDHPQERDPTLLEKITDPVKNLFKGDDECKKETECIHKGTLPDELKK